MIVSAAVYLKFRDQRYFVNDFNGLFSFAYEELTTQAGGRECEKPKGYIRYTTYLDGFNTYTDTIYVLSARINE